MNYQKSVITNEGTKIGDYLLEKEIGKGSFGSVYRAKEITTGTTYAIKKLLKSKYNRNEILKRLLKSEISIMHKIKHPNILHLYKFLETSEHYYLVVDYCNKGDLEGVLKKVPGNKFDEKTAVLYLKQIMNGFQELRRYKILHRDFKMANIFLNDFRIVIGDFGFAKSGFEVAETRLGTPLTMAPEILIASDDNSTYNSKADLWSIGVVFYEMLYGVSPFFATTENEIAQKIRRISGDKMTFSGGISQESQHLIRSLLQMDPQKRINWQDFFNHPIFLKFKTDEVDPQKNQNNFGQLIIDNRSVIDNEFAQNKANPTQIQGFLNTDELAGITEMLPLQVKEEAIDPASSEQYTLEILFRYHHEKNKILFLTYTAKKLEEAFINNSFPFSRDVIYNLHVLILKKATLLNQLMILNLSNKLNTFGINETIFNAFINSSKYKEVYMKFYSDHSMNFSSLEQKTKNAPVQLMNYDLLAQSSPKIQELDYAIWENYIKFKEAASKIDPMKEKTFFYLLTCITCSIYSETSFPFKYNEEKFAWEKFYSQLNTYQAQDLMKIIS